ncbi:MAG: transcription antitermination factor NusB [Phycisphaeraceae bacterium]
MKTEPTTQATQTARRWAAERLARVAQRFPEIEPPDMDLAGLSPADTALALAIYRTTVQRWFTLSAIVEKYLSKQLRRLEPEMQAVLLSGAAQRVFFDRLPAYAVVDESVRLAHAMVRPNAAGMANAVLRKVDRLVQKSERVDRWEAGANALPLPGGGGMRFAEAVLPPASPLDKHLVAATSVPLRLVREWLGRFGEAQTIALCLQGIEHPPTVVAVEPDFQPGPDKAHCRPHRVAGFVVWQGPGEGLSAFLTRHVDRRVQDVASSLAVGSTRGHEPGSILDYCAGLGTKTRQLARMHPGATIHATDTHAGRRASLRSVAAGLDNATVIEPDEAGRGGGYDLVLLDVPCSNTGVLARRPEARYRYSQQSLGELVKLQRAIVDRASAWVKPGGLLLYSTCSIEPPENAKQAERRLRRGGEKLHEHQQMPQGSGDTYTDGSYHALLKV